MKDDFKGETWKEILWQLLNSDSYPNIGLWEKYSRYFPNRQQSGN